MKLSVETVGRLLASSRGYAQAFVGFAGTLGLVSASQGKTLTDSLGEIANGISMIYHGFTSIWQVAVIVTAPIASVVLAKWSSNSAKTSNQAASVQAAIKDPNTPVSIETKAAVLDAAMSVPEVKTPAIVVTDPVIAELAPSSKVKPVA